MLGQLGRDLLNVEHRILDHRPFVNGEINHFLNEFELKRNEIEVETLFKVTETVGDLKYDLLERCLSLSTTHLKELGQEVDNLFLGIEQFLSKAQLPKEQSETLTKSRENRVLKRDSFLLDLNHRYDRVKNSFEEKEEEIDELYSDLQVKLNIPK
ncbi:biogenesis of lysosome-related organelles complex 1 subunit 5 [Ceratitis capitata]|uniref:Biogenesis of lysosome-related organelles complex 1 subunit 5 n=2 Tax=Ceratitis capitata TaxID=7213 RepID=A0A811U805_CERCA|nr:biogenesis of lysosome-related organelles complex 1 subunit 5 [Ceratitis capitata]CAD6994971.1 unnamed protein product [Ceratitis capitata]